MRNEVSTAPGDRIVIRYYSRTMIIHRAEVLGMCMGVRRAEALAREAGAAGAASGKQVFTYGPLIHNPQAIESLRKYGVQVLDPEQFELGLLDDQVKNSIVVIRAHGAPLSTFNRLKALSAAIIDATCPRVLASQKKAVQLLHDGYVVIIAGDASHGEVAGILGHAPGAMVAENPESARRIANSIEASKAALIAQTTIKESEYKAIENALKEKFPGLLVIQTICPATRDRQEALRLLADSVDALVIAGGKNSANTKRLFMAALESGKPAWHIEKPEELPDEVFDKEVVGLTAGASTPDFIVDEVEKYLMQGANRHGIAE